jgi:hypothetical protein
MVPTGLAFTPLLLQSWSNYVHIKGYIKLKRLRGGIHSRSQFTRALESQRRGVLVPRLLARAKHKQTDSLRIRARSQFTREALESQGDLKMPCGKLLPHDTSSLDLRIQKAANQSLAAPVPVF